MTKGAVGETLQKGQQKKRDRRQWKDNKKLTKKRVGKSAVAHGENTEISAGNALKIHKCHRLNTAKCYKNTNSEYRTFFFLIGIHSMHSWTATTRHGVKRIPEFSSARKETVDIDILVTSRNGDTKIMQSIRIMRRPPLRKRKLNQLSQFWKMSAKVIPIEKT